jgi:ribonuclease HI
MSIEAHFDGACEPNPNGVAAYAVIVRRDGEVIHQVAERVPNLGHGTSNNLAEYAGLVAALKFLIGASLQREPVGIIGDSQVVINQMFGTWQVHGGSYAALAREAAELLKQFTRIDGVWVPRDQNVEADALSRQAIVAAFLGPRVHQC